MPDLAAVILAAGQSARMGRFKPLLPLGKGTIIGRVVDLFQQGGISDIRVVVGHRAEDLKPLVGRLGAEAILNKKHLDGMFSSVLTGVAGLPIETRAFFILPVDIPLVRPATLERMLEAHRRRPDHIIHPCFQANRGHPPLIPTKYIPDIIASTGEGGLRAVLDRLRPSAVNLEVPDEHILLDLDRPEDYERILSRWSRYEAPSPAECDVILSLTCGSTSPFASHGRATADVADVLCTALRHAGNGLDPDVVHAAAVLHDLAKGQPDHALAAGRILNRMGFARVAEVVAVHTDMDVPSEGPVREGEVVFFADKLVSGDRSVSVAQRFQTARDRFGHDPAALAAIERRHRTTGQIQQRIEAETGRTVASILEDGRLSVTGMDPET